MEGFTQFIIIIGAILEIIVLICFFILCSNVSKIKKSLFSDTNTNYGRKIMCLLSLNEKDKAKDLLIKNIKTDIDAYIETYPSASKKKVATYIEKLYKPYLEALDMKIDLSIFDEPKQ